MPRTNVYVNGDTGNDSNNGLSLGASLKTLANAAVVADAQFSLNPDGVHVHAYGYFQIPSGGDYNDVLFLTGSTHTNLKVTFYDGAWQIFGTKFDITGAGYQVFPLVLPSGVTLEWVEINHERAGTPLVDSNGGYKTLFTQAANSASVAVFPDTSFHDGSFLYVNPVSTSSGSIVARYSFAGDLNLCRVVGSDITFEYLGNSGTLRPPRKSAGTTTYAVQFLSVTGHTSGYTFRGGRHYGCWHDVGILDTSLSGSLAFSNINISGCRFVAQVVGNQALTVSYNPVVVYTGNNTGTLATPVYLDITDWYCDDIRVELHRPRFLDGTVLGNTVDVYGNAITGGFFGNNYANLFHSHGSNDHLLPRVFNTRGWRRIHVDTWEYRVTSLCLFQRNYQTLTYVPLSDAAWGCWVEDSTVTSRLPYISAYENTGYGIYDFTSGAHHRMVRCHIIGPDRAVHSPTGGTALYTLGSGADTRFTTTINEFVACLIELPGNSLTSGNPWYRNIRIGSTATTVGQLYMYNCAFVLGGTTTFGDLVWWDVDGTANAATIHWENTVYHSEDPTKTQFLYDATTTELPLYGTNPNRLVARNGFYSGIAVGKFDTSGGGQRNTEAEWRTGADGPHDGTLADGASGNNRDARYTIAGTWNNTTHRFADDDIISTTMIDPTADLGYQVAGIGGGLWNSRFGPWQDGTLDVGYLLTYDINRRNRMVHSLQVDITGNVSSEPLLNTRGDRPFRGGGVEAGGRIVLGTATTADVLVTDGVGRELYNGTVTDDVTIDPASRGVVAPISVTVTNISNAAHTLSVYWSVSGN